MSGGDNDEVKREEARQHGSSTRQQIALARPNACISVNCRESLFVDFLFIYSVFFCT